MSKKQTLKQVLLLVIGTLPLSAALAASGSFEPLPDGIIAAGDISGIATHNNFLLIGADEADGANLNAVQVLSGVADGKLKLESDRQIDLFVGVETDDGGVEMDIEGIAVEGDTVVVVGSHSAKRPRLKKKKYAKNRERLKATAIKAEPNRGRIYRLQLDGSGKVKSMDHISLSKLLAKHPVLGPYAPLPSKENGIDIEGIAVEGDTVVVVGSHSAKRPRLKKKKYDKNRKRLQAEAIKAEPNRGRIYHLQLDDNGKVESMAHISLSTLLAKHPVLGPYTPLPSKENGIDIEGVALADGKLYLGFRGPVLRDGYVPVMVLDFDSPEENELKFVRLGGRGIRDITRVSDGFLVIAGPVGDGMASYQLYHWDGGDMVPGKKRGGHDLGVVTPLRKIKPPTGGKAEGVTVISESDDGYHLLIAYDGVVDRGEVLQHLNVSKDGS
jgi:hypothetical protein